jgi:multiple sugar transport system substrate-binding protein
MMWATGAHVVPTSASDEALRDGDIKGVLEILHKMWTDGLMPEAVRGAGPSEFHSAFYPGKLGMFAHGNFQIGLITNKAPNLDFGITFIPGNWLDAGLRTILHHDDRRTRESDYYVRLLDLYELFHLL